MYLKFDSSFKQNYKKCSKRLLRENHYNHLYILTYQKATILSVQPFTHLHLHTEYSLLDGANKLTNLVTQVKELGMTSVAMTDHGNMFGAIDFYKQMIAAEI